jgi:hypothetical protein
MNTRPLPKTNPPPAEATPAEEELPIEEKIRRQEKLAHAGTEAAAVTSGIMAGALMGSVAGPPGVAVGAIAGGLVGIVAGVVLDKDEQHRDAANIEADRLSVEQDQTISNNADWQADLERQLRSVPPKNAGEEDPAPEAGKQELAPRREAGRVGGPRSRGAACPVVMSMRRRPRRKPLRDPSGRHEPASTEPWKAAAMRSAREVRRSSRRSSARPTLRAWASATRTTRRLPRVTAV